MKTKMMCVFLFFTALLAAHCNKNKQEVVSPANSATAQAPAAVAPAPASTEVATGEMKELLLALKRVHFAFDSSTLIPEARTALDEAGQKLRSNPKVELWVDGHSDERGTTEYNMSLGERRAKAVLDYLKNLGIEQQRLSIVSFGEEKPLVDKPTDDAYARNRRVDFRLMRGDIQLVLEEGELVDDEGKRIAN